jgi:hypothetical protein
VRDFTSFTEGQFGVARYATAGRNQRVRDDLAKKALCRKSFPRRSRRTAGPDRSVAKWRDLRFLPIPQPLQPEPPLSPCHPDRSEAKWRDLQCALRLSQILPGKQPGMNHPSNQAPPPNPMLPCLAADYLSGFVRTDGLGIAYLGAHEAAGPCFLCRKSTCGYLTLSGEPSSHSL